MLTLATLLAAVPAVVLSAEHAAMTRVAVGDPFPAVEGRSPEGIVSLATLRGEKATVVAAPGGPPWMDAMMSGDLATDFAPKYTSRGVRIVVLGGAAGAEGVTPLALPAGRVTELLGEGRMPRVYVLDGQGRVVWFDLEYTLSTHRELHQALDTLVGG